MLMDELSGLLVQSLHRRFKAPSKWAEHSVEDQCHGILASTDISAQLVEDFSRALTCENAVGRPQETGSVTEICRAAGVTIPAEREYRL